MSSPTGMAGEPDLPFTPPSRIGKVEHPINGTYYIYYDYGSRCYGLSKVIHPIHCGYASLAAAFASKGL